MKTPLFLTALMLLLVPLANGQAGPGQTAALSLTVPAYIQLDAGAAPIAISTLGDEIDVANTTPDLVGKLENHDVVVHTNSGSGATLNLNVVSTSTAAFGQPWDDVTLAVSSGGVTPGSTAASGSNPGTFAGRSCTANCSAPLVTAIRGGEYTWKVQYQLTLGTRYALSGTRSFNAVYTVSL